LLSKNKYYTYKKSAFIKMGLYLKLNDISLKYEKEIPNLQERFEFISNNY
jgi:prophage maintenance system killer protein